jgi:hypothetical protein
MSGASILEAATNVTVYGTLNAAGTVRLLIAHIWRSY